MLEIIEKSDVALSRALFSVHRNTDIAARFITDEIHRMARGAS